MDFLNKTYIFIETTEDMRLIDESEKDEICREYICGATIKEIFSKHKIGDRRARKILIERGIEIRNPHERTTSGNDCIEAFERKFVADDGHKFVAVAKNDNNVIYDDFLNKSGCITTYIKNVLCAEVPSSFKRKKYLKETGKQWYEQYFNIVEIKTNKHETKKCPYCSWETMDINNNSGAFEVHLLREHGVSKVEYLSEHPEDNSYFLLANKTLSRQTETDKRKYVECTICGRKLARLDWRHLAKHGITKEEYIRRYSSNIVSDELHLKLSRNTTELNKSMKPTYSSKPELEIKRFIESFGVACRNNDRKILNGKELDIYIPEKKIAIEYNGNFWHSDDVVDKHKHLEKTILCKEKGIKLLQIFEDEYMLHRDVVFGKIKHIIGISDVHNRIPGRKCTIRTINNYTAKEFLDKYHIQGFVRSTVYLGAYYNEDIIAVMSFKRELKDSDSWELTRFASNYNYICQGVGGKLFKEFLREYKPEEVKSFADRRWTVDEENNIYIKLGFEFAGYIKPDYMYYAPKLDRYKRFHKFGFRKQILHKKYGLSLSMTEMEMTRKLKFKRIWNCGLIKYVWKRKTI